MVTFSHLVYSTSNLETQARALEKFGYVVDRNGRGKNPKEKAPFVKDSLKESYHMSFLRGNDSRSSLPPIELLSEDGVTHGRDFKRYYMVFSNSNENTWGDFSFDSKEASILEDVGAFEAVKKFQGIYIRTCDLEASLNFWRRLNFAPSPLTDNISCITLSTLMGRDKYTIYFLEENKSETKMSLDGKGLVCLSLLVMDLNSVRKTLAAVPGLEVGECFTVEPLGRPLKVFFVRTSTGELYEFLTPLHSKT